MPTISLSNDFMFGATPNGLSRFTQIGSNSFVITNPSCPIIGRVSSSGINASSSDITLMGGTMPAVSSLSTTGNPVGTTILATFSAYDGNTFGASISGSTLTFSGTYVAATASGTATWFWFKTRSAVLSTFIAYNHTIGTVGLPGSGADLEIATTSIVSGNLYKIARLRFTLPTTFTY